MNETATLTPPVSKRDHVKGTAGAPVTLVEYGDYQCPYCGAVHPVVRRLQGSLGHKLRFVFRNFPLTQAHPHAMIAAEAAEAAALQGRFWEMHDFTYENQDELEPDILTVWAERLGLDVKQFGIAIKDGQATNRIKQDRVSGIRSGVNGTPCFFINGTRYDGNADFDGLHAALEESNRATI